MNGTLRIFRAELMRLAGGWTVWLVGAAIASVAGLQALVTKVEVLQRGDFESGGAWAPLVDGWLAGLKLATFALLVASARSIAGDHESGLLRMAVTRSCSRAALFLGRLLIGPLTVLGSILAAGLGALLVAGSGLDFGPLVEDGYPLLEVDELILEVQRAVLAVAPALLSIWTLGLLLSTFSRSAVGAVAGTLVLFIIFDLLKDALGNETKYLIFASYAPSLVDTSALGEAAGRVRGYSDSGFGDELFRLAHVMPWLGALAGGVISILILRKRAL